MSVGDYCGGVVIGVNNESVVICYVGVFVSIPLSLEGWLQKDYVPLMWEGCRTV